MFSRTPSPKTPRYILFNRRKIKVFLAPSKNRISKSFFGGKNFFILKFNWFHLKIKLRFYWQNKKELSKISTTKVLKLNSSLNRQSVNRIQISILVKIIMWNTGRGICAAAPVSAWPRPTINRLSRPLILSRNTRFTIYLSLMKSHTSSIVMSNDSPATTKLLLSIMR